MTADNLTRIDPEKNMTRFYKLDVKPTLSGEGAVICESGRMTVRSTPYKNAQEAEAARDRQRQVKERRGQHP